MGFLIHLDKPLFGVNRCLYNNDALLSFLKFIYPFYLLDVLSVSQDAKILLKLLGFFYLALVARKPDFDACEQ